MLNHLYNIIIVAVILSSGMIVLVVKVVQIAMFMGSTLLDIVFKNFEF